MQLTSHRLARVAPATSEDGFTLIFALGVMLITSMLVFAALTMTTNDEHLSYHETLAKKAFLAAQAGEQEYEHSLQVEDDYWEKSCEGPKGSVSGETSEQYETTVLGANGKSCNAAQPFETMIEKSGIDANSFRVKSTGSAGGIKRQLIATFKVSNFLDWAYFTQYEDEDPVLYNGSQRECEKYYEEETSPGHKERRSSNCRDIVFDSEDGVNGPMHTDDSADVECSTSLSFGRKAKKEEGQADTVEIHGGTWSSSSSTPHGPEGGTCSAGSEPKFYTQSGKFETGEIVEAPKSDSSVAAYVETGYQFVGRTEIELKGSKIKVKNANFNGGVAKEILAPKNGLVFVANGSNGCNYAYTNATGGSDTSTTDSEEAECGSVWVNGEYEQSLTIAAETDVVIDGQLVPTGVTPGSPPSGTAVLGLMATRFVRIAHACSSRSGNEEPSVENEWIYAAMLSTSHSFLVDNYGCGSSLGKLDVYGAIAQKFRGVVGTVSSGRVVSGYAKNYIYDERLATDEPPYFLAPLNAGWRIVRETAPKPG